MSSRQTHIQQIMYDLGIISRRLVQGQGAARPELNSTLWRKRERELLSLPSRPAPSAAQMRALLGVLKHCLVHKRGPSGKELAATLGVTGSAISQTVNTLVEDGFLVREPGEGDRRILLIKPSPVLWERMKHIQKAALTHLSPVFDALSAEELEEYQRLNRKLVDAIKKAGK
jgi:DNA-binding MarR family transcriptional regulator